MNRPNHFKIKNYSRLILICLCIFLSASDTYGQKKKKKNKKQPEWVENIQSVYPDIQYIASLGVSDSHDGAKKRAAAGIAERFKTRINVEQSYLQRYHSFTDAEGNMVESGEEGLQKQIDTYADETLMNIAYGDFYTDDAGRVYVIGYIDRMKTAPIYADKIRKNDRQMDNYFSKGKQQRDPVAKYAYINAAYIISLYNEQLREQLAIIDQNAVEITIVSHGDLVEARTKAAADIKYSVYVDFDEDDKVKSKISEILTKSGFQIVENKETAILFIDADVSFEDIDLDRGDLKFIGWNLKISMDDTADKTLLALNESSRDGGKNKGTAKRMAYRSIYKYIENEFHRELNTFFDKAVKKEDF